MGCDREIQATTEFERIRSLPRRDAGGYTAELTNLLRTTDGRMVLRDMQATALHDVGVKGGLLAPIRVGGGKTLISLLSPYVLGARRPLLLIPASLAQKTEHDRRVLSQHWRIPRHIRIMSYEMLGRVSAARELDLYLPDLIVADECHRLKNPRAACTRRVARYMKEHPDTKFVAMSGTVIKHSLRDFAAQAGWALKDGVPLPREWGELEEWADALDTKVNFLRRVKPGVLGATTEAAREWFHDRLMSTPGVVGSAGDQVSCSLQIRALQHPVSSVTEENFRILRETWCTPDGFAYSDAMSIWRHARELALGMHYTWDPRAPDAWLSARREWASFAREAIKNSTNSKHPMDSELQVVNAIDREEINDYGTLKAWREIKSTFEINSKPVWHDDSALEACTAWGHAHKGIIWTDHTFFATELARRSNWEYFGAGGLSRSGRSIDAEDGSRTIIASISANSTGRNLQRFHRSLVTACCSGADQWEQLLGRTHRDGQEADSVEVDVLYACAEHHDAMARSLLDAQMHQQVLGQPQKLLLADMTWPAQKPDGGFRWVKSTQ